MWTSERLEKAYALIDAEMAAQVEASAIAEGDRAEEALLHVLNAIEAADDALEEIA